MIFAHSHSLTRYLFRSLPNLQLPINSNAAAQPFDKRNPREKAMHDSAAEEEVGGMIDAYMSSLPKDEVRKWIGVYV